MSSLRNRVLIVFGIPVVIYVLLVLGVMVFQRQLMYMPSTLSPEEAARYASENGLAPWRNAAGEIIGWTAASGSLSEGSVLIVHGNAGTATHRSYFTKPIHEALPVDVYILEYPGYGARPGSPSLQGYLDAGEEALRSLPGDKPVYLVSESIGTGVAAHLAKAQPDRIKGLAMFVPYDDLGNVGQAAMPFLPVKLMMFDRFKPALWLADYRGPLKVVLAGEDEVIPVRFGQSLYDSYAGPKSLEVIPNALHNAVAAQSPGWWVTVFAFWRGPR